MHKRVMALLLSLVLLLSAAMPVTAMAAEEYAGSFVLVAMNANSTIVEPVSSINLGKPFNRRWRIQILTLSAWKTDSSMRSTAFPPITCSIMTRVAISWTLRLLPSRPFASMYLRLIRTQLSS